jgi:NAD(P)H-dependent FMN reductase
MGLPVGRWAFEHAARNPAFEARLIDLAEINLPMFDEPEHPRLRKYVHQHTKDWSAMVSEADALVVVTAEYNTSAPPALVNAFDYLLHEWAYMPVGFVSYGGFSGGLRSVSASKLMVTTLRMMPLPDGVSINFVAQQVKDGVFNATDANVKALDAMLAELAKWATALAQLRRPPK